MIRAKMRKFRCKLPGHGFSWLEVEAADADAAMDEAARKYGYKGWHEMRMNLEKIGFGPIASPEDFGFQVVLVREKD